MADLQRVVVTGAAGFCPLGGSWDEIADGLATHRSGIRRMDDWDRYTDMRTRLAGEVPAFELPPTYTRKKIRTMGRVAKLAVRSTELALEQARFDLQAADLTQIGVAYGSSSALICRCRPTVPSCFWLSRRHVQSYLLSPPTYHS